MTESGGRRWWLRGLVAFLVLAALTGVVGLFFLRVRPRPAPTDGAPAVGTITEPDFSGHRTYESKTLRFRFRYPGGWSLKESGAAKAPEGEYLTITMLPDRAVGPEPSVTPVLLEVVPDPQGFSAEAVVDMKWGSAPGTMTVTTGTVDFAGLRGVEVVVADTVGRPKSLFGYEAIATVPDRMFRLSVSSSKRGQLEAMSAEVREIAKSLETY